MALKRPGWTNIARQRHYAAEQALVRSLPEFEMPVADSTYTAPGHRLLSETIYCYKDVMRPWDPAVIRAIREFEPTAMPITIRSTWQKMDRGNPQEPFTLIRHGIARGVRDAVIPTHRYRCEMPIHRDPYLFSSFPNVYTKTAPNYVEINHYDRHDRPYGYDLPGAYLPFNWDLYHMLYRDYENNRRWQDIAADVLDPEVAAKEKQEQEDAEYDAYVQKELSKHWNEPASDLEWKEALEAPPQLPESSPMVTVPSQVVEVAATASASVA